MVLSGMWCPCCKLTTPCCDAVLCCAALEGAEHIVIEGAKHVPLSKQPDVHWYGSGPYLEAWVDRLHPEGAVKALTRSSSSSS